VTAASDKPNTATMPIPADALPVLPVRNTLLLPGVVLPLAIGREASVAAAQEALRTGRRVIVVLQRDPTTEEPAAQDLYEVGTAAAIVRYVTAPDGGHHLICQGEQRVRLKEFLPGYPYLVARFDAEVEPPATGAQIDARAQYLKELALQAIELLPQAPAELGTAVQQIAAPGQLADIITSFIDAKPAEKQDVLETADVKARLEKVIALLARRIEVLKIARDIRHQTQEALDQRQKEILLREQMRQIQKELGESDEAAGEIGELEQAVAAAGMPAEAAEQARKELKRLARMNEGGPEYSMVRSYVDWLVALPWSKLDPETIDIDKARALLDEEHFGLAKIKRRILEFLAVRKLNPEGKSPILCFVGPPGVGKTSLGQSIAKAVGLKFARASLGGVHDEAEIRGHRRTYIGSLPGNILQALRKAGTRNPVFILDEIDKLSSSIQGDPSSALLEVLDPEQNSTFRDNYIGVPFDLSRVLFIATANVLDTIPGPLRDRMEVIELTGYTDDEKLEIAKRHLLPRQLRANGLKSEQATLTDAAVLTVIREYTREAGCRNLERQLGSLLRNVAVRIASGETAAITVDAAAVASILGPSRFEDEVALRTSLPGVATGLAWTPAGGDILFIESARLPGSGKLILTGQLGDVMKESAQTALSLVKSRATELAIDTSVFDKIDVHIHFPAGAIPKDGPSAGVAILTSLVSLLTNRPVRHDVAMTGEISLRGLVLPVGGIKEKTVAAARAGIRTVVLPARNRKDFDDIPASARKALEFIWAERVEDVLVAAFGSGTRADQAKSAA
jgi:ATP-dependent Lon protease